MYAQIIDLYVNSYSTQEAYDWCLNYGPDRTWREPLVKLSDADLLELSNRSSNVPSSEEQLFGSLGHVHVRLARFSTSYDSDYFILEMNAVPFTPKKHAGAHFTSTHARLCAQSHQEAAEILKIITPSSEALTDQDGNPNPASSTPLKAPKSRSI